MAFFLNKTSLPSHFRSRSQKTDGALALPRRGYHVDLGDREKALNDLLDLEVERVNIVYRSLRLLAEDPTLRKFKSEKNPVRRIKRISDGLTIAIVVGCAYEFYIRTVVREEAQKQAGEKA